MNAEIFESILAQSERALVPTDINTEAEVLYYMLDAFKTVRPSIVLQIGRQVSGPVQFLDVLKLTLMAAANPEHAELFAGDAVDTFAPDEANKADNTYRLILTVVAESLDPDPEWIAARNTTTRVHGWINGGDE